MNNALLPVSFLLIAVTGIAAYWYRALQRDQVRKRLFSVGAETGSADQQQAVVPFAERSFFLPWLIVVPIGSLVCWYWQIPLNISAGLIVVFGFIGAEIDAWLYQWRLARMETQLADTIDVLVASVGAGASLQASLQQASEYTPMPLRAELAEMVARLRLGDSPADVFQLLGQRVPTETFRLISTTLTVNWRMGGELGHTLSAIGTTIRDRLAIARQLRTLSTQGAMTTITVLTVIWFMAAMMWQADPPRFVSFLLSTEGSWLIAACLVMQGLGIAMISRISRPKI
ncbi:Bacterial type II secretion system protein F domain protein [Stieleria bergensis]|uniref:Bacterial type II secretion system protein F domain protein n=1 Tax=Stieleria bergensis TaxID=2528025 RepID=A0A517SSX6_9BACT|nr:MAG: hypothetical protein CBB71_22020 [Rhodopirellula sp. TMED11]QDT59226.1 Bacterial type II secretion system protein F domain protein [Planctomycetes bacterium SV_7m_r]